MFKKIGQVYTKQYKDETRLFNYMKNEGKEKIMIRNESEEVDVKINRLKDIDFTPVFHIEVGDFEDEKNNI